MRPPSVSRDDLCPGAKAELLVCVVQVCKFLVSLSKDFSSYYNRVHVLGVSASSSPYIHVVHP